MKRVDGMVYAAEHGERGVGDLFLPEGEAGAPVALCIHSGGWNAMDKRSWEGVAGWMCRLGYAAFNINYRLLEQACWPACGEDCLRAAAFLLSGEHEAFRGLDRSGVTVIGGSAGGHLALMTGLRLEAGRVRAIVSVSGPTDLREQFGAQGMARYPLFFGVGREGTAEMLLEASPVHYVRRGSPALLCVHSVNDRLVDAAQARGIVARYREVGARAELHAFDGPGEQHGIWIEGSDPHRLFPELEQAIGDFLGGVE